MDAVMRILRSPKDKKIITWVVKQVSIIICIVLLMTADDLIADGVSKNWLPTLGFVLGMSLTCFGFYIVFPFFGKIRTMEATRTEKVAWISGIALAILGSAVMALNNSIAVIFNVQSLHTFVVSFVVGFGIVCISYWIMTLSSELFKGDRKWKFYGIVLHSVLLIGVLIKYAFR